MINKPDINRIKTLLITLIVLLFSAFQLSAQNLRVNDDIGGGGNTTDPQNSSNNTFIYVAAGLVIGGILAYALLRDKGKDESDSTSVGNESENNLRISYLEDFNTEVLKAKEKIQVDVFFGIRNEDDIIPEKTYLMGLSLKF